MAVSVPPAGRGARGRRPDQLTGGRHGLTPEEVEASQRDRILAAITVAVGDRGFHGVRVADVVWHAGVSRKTFYERFEGKEECFAAAYELWIGRLLETTFEAFETQSEWSDQLRAAMAALLGALAREPDAARLCFAEAVAVDGPTTAARDRALERLSRLFTPPDLPEGPLGDTLRSGRVCELSETLRREIAAGRTESLPALAPELMCAMVLPFLGVDAAQRELDRAPTRPR